MGWRRKYELKLLHAAGVGSLRRVKRLLIGNDDGDEDDDEEEEDKYDSSGNSTSFSTDRSSSSSESSRSDESSRGSDGEERAAGASDVDREWDTEGEEERGKGGGGERSFEKFQEKRGHERTNSVRNGDRRGEGQMGLERENRKRKRRSDIDREEAKRRKMKKKMKKKKREREKRLREKERMKKQKEKRKKRKRKKALDVNCQDVEGLTPLHHACYVGAVDLAKYLLYCGADANAADRLGNTPLHIVAKLGHAKLIGELREVGGNMAARNKRGETPEQLVAAKLGSLSKKWERVVSGSRFEDPAGWDEKLEEAVSDGDGGHRRCDWGRGGGGACVWGGGGEDAEWEAEVSLGHGGDMGKKIAEAIRKNKHIQARAMEERHARIRAAMVREEEERERMKESEIRRRKREQEDKHKGMEEENSKRNAARILEEEQAKDKAWGESVLQGKWLQKKQRYEDAWETFSASCNMCVCFLDVPFPIEEGKEKDLEKILLHGVPLADQKKKIREEVVRWHPDKFMQRWGQRLSPADSVKILGRVKDISQAVHEIYSRVAGKD